MYMKRSRVFGRLMLLSMIILAQSAWSQNAPRVSLVDQHNPLDWESVSLSLLVSEVEAGAEEAGLENFAVEVVGNTTSITYRDLQFLPDSPEIIPETAEKIVLMSNVLQRFANRNILVEGHTARIQANDGTVLSNQRANAVADAMAATGIFNRDMISAVGQGDRFPVYEGETAEGLAQNRRVEISILDEADASVAPQSLWWKQYTDVKAAGATVFVVPDPAVSAAMVRAALQEAEDRSGTPVGNLAVFQTTEGIAVVYDDAAFTDGDVPTSTTRNAVLSVSDALAELDPRTQVRIGGFGDDTAAGRADERQYQLGLLIAGESEIRPSSTLVGDVPQSFLFTPDTASAFVPVQTADDTPPPEDEEETPRQRAFPWFIDSVELSGNGTLPRGRYAEFSRFAVGAGARFDMLVPGFQDLDGLAPVRIGLGVAGLYHFPNETSSVRDLTEFDWVLTTGYTLPIGARFRLTPQIGYGGTVHVMDYTKEVDPDTFEAVNGGTFYSQTFAAELDFALLPAAWQVGETSRFGLFLRPGYRVFFDEEFFGHSITARLGGRFYF